VRSGTCPKCGSTDLHSHETTSSAIGRLVNFPQPGSTANVAIEVYVCGACGYIEQYVADPQDLGRLSKEWSASGLDEEET
jgi:predicted nucleic-acid-binding Zn-ribbon protein